MSLPPASGARFARRTFVLAALTLLAGCPSAEPEQRLDPPVPEQRLDPTVPETWVRPDRGTSTVFWTVHADVRDFVGAERWAALDTAWMADRSRADLAALTTENQYSDEYLLSGLWRLGLLREEVLAALAAREANADWPLMRRSRQLCIAWRPRLERWRRAQTEGETRARLERELEFTWRQALAVGDVGIMAQVVEARDTWLGEWDADAVSSDVEKLVRDSLARIEARSARGWRDAGIPAGLLRLMERFGVPEGVDLDPVVRAFRHLSRKLRGESIPLPHPYDLHISLLRLERLCDTRR